MVGRSWIAHRQSLIVGSAELRFCRGRARGYRRPIVNLLRPSRDVGLLSKDNRRELSQGLKGCAALALCFQRQPQIRFRGGRYSPMFAAARRAISLKIASSVPV